MRTLGILGGMSPASTEIYYRALNEGVRARLGGFSSAHLVIHSVNFAEIEGLQAVDDWTAAGAILAEAASRLEAAGADAILMACNTMHRCADQIEAATDLPFLHIADAAAARLKTAGSARPALLGTRKTMEMAFYMDRLKHGHGIEVIVPNAPTRMEIDRIIFDELAMGVARPESAQYYVGVCDMLKAAGADSILMGCTEIGMILNEGNCPLPCHDTAFIHVDAALDFILQDVAAA